MDIEDIELIETITKANLKCCNMHGLYMDSVTGEQFSKREEVRTDCINIKGGGIQLITNVIII